MPSCCGSSDTAALASCRSRRGTCCSPRRRRCPVRWWRSTPSFSIDEFEQQQERFTASTIQASAELDDYLVLAAFEDSEFDGKVHPAERNVLEAERASRRAERRARLPASCSTTRRRRSDRSSSRTARRRPDETVSGRTEVSRSREVDRAAGRRTHRAICPTRRIAGTSSVQADAKPDVELEFETTCSTATTGTTELDEAALSSSSPTRVTENASEHVRRRRRTARFGGPSTGTIRATPLRDGPEVRGAVFADGRSRPSSTTPTPDLRNQVILLALAIVVGSVIAAWFRCGPHDPPDRPERWRSRNASSPMRPTSSARRSPRSDSPPSRLDPRPRRPTSPAWPNSPPTPRH